MPSGWLRRGVAGHAVEEERHERGACALRATSAKSRWNSSRVARRRSSGGSRMPATSTRAPAAWKRATIGVEVRAHAGEVLAAQGVVGAERHDHDAGLSRSAQSTRRSPPAVVSPDTPALTTR